MTLRTPEVWIEEHTLPTFGAKLFCILHDAWLPPGHEARLIEHKKKLEYVVLTTCHFIRKTYCKNQHYGQKVSSPLHRKKKKRQRHYIAKHFQVLKPITLEQIAMMHFSNWYTFPLSLID